MDQVIRERAYFLWEDEGRPSGRDHAHWVMAERAVRGQAMATVSQRPKPAKARRKTAAAMEQAGSAAKRSRVGSPDPIRSH